MIDTRKDCWTFEDYIMHLIHTKQTDSIEFQTMLKIMGREKLEAIYRKHRSQPPKTTSHVVSDRTERDTYEWRQEMLYK